MEQKPGKYIEIWEKHHTTLIGTRCCYERKIERDHRMVGLDVSGFEDGRLFFQGGPVPRYR
jgi:hypothetical protein